MNKEVGQEIHAKAEPFLKWLKEAEEEDSEDEESEGDIGVGINVILASCLRLPSISMLSFLLECTALS